MVQLHNGSDIMVYVKKRWPIPLFFLVILSSCGYTFSGSGSLPENIQSVYVEVLKNNSSETRLESIFSNDLIDEFAKRDKRLLKRKDVADAVLTGTIKSVLFSTVLHSDQNVTFQERVEIIVDLQLNSGDGATVLWKRENIRESEIYDVDQENRLDTEQRKREALEKISERFAETVFRLLTEDF